jgi:hypothetical protein
MTKVSIDFLFSQPQRSSVAGIKAGKAIIQITRLEAKGIFEMESVLL